MSEGPYIAEPASLIGDPARANMLAALLDGRALTATELGITAGVAPPTASGHLAKLLEGRLVTVTSTGRHRYYRLASPAVARVLESLMALAIDGPPRHRPNARCGEEMARARTCYDHLAGRLGVSLADSLAKQEHVVLTEQGGFITNKGRAFLDKFGVDLSAPGKSRRAFCRPCLDWSERRLHIGGYIGAAIADRCMTLGWTERRKDGRALIITPAGEQAFDSVFGIRV